MMRSTSMSLSMLALAASVGAAMAADMPVKAPPVAPEKIEYGNLYFGVDWTSHRSLAGYVGVLYAPGGMERAVYQLACQLQARGVETDDGLRVRGEFVV